MKFLTYVLIITITSVASFFVGSAYQNLEAANRSEDIIANEFPIIERNKSIPSCSDITATTEKITINKNGSDYVLWSYDSQQDLLKKTIVTSDMNTIYTESPTTCKQ